MRNHKLISKKVKCKGVTLI